jgi:DNA processing protein
MGWAAVGGHMPDSLLPWFHLKNVRGVGNHLFKRLIERFGSPAAALQASVQELSRVEGISAGVIEAIRTAPRSGAAAAEIDAVHRQGYRLVTLTDPAYPELLRRIPDPPPLLYVWGELPGAQPSVALVGSRNATPYGLDMTHRLASDLARLGFAVVSGMALGIDAAAHEGALSGGGRTVAVLGSGLDNLYPPQHRRLSERIAANGAVISEFPLAALPEAHHFPIRNRIISGMCAGTVVVEATKKSGSLITARLAADQNREVFAVPGSIQSFKSMGTHTLIKQGAKLVENVQDIVSELAPLLAVASPATAREPVSAQERHRLTEEESRVYRALSPYPLHIDEILRSLSMDAGRLSAVLLQLELKGVVRQMPGKLFAAADEPRAPITHT